ncbi:MAG: HD domain-containing protein [Clostridia bacterium]|nr:HD domain-containing protein [Clostridia bacterium]
MQEENVIRFYLMCNKLKTLIRSGWQTWHVKAERVESVAEHIYGVQMLAIAMCSEFNYKINLEKVIFMLAVHELEEIVIGDLTPFDKAYNEKERLGHEAIKTVLKELNCAQKLEDLILEFDARKTKEAHFAYQCDKLESDIQCKLYDENNCVDLSAQENNEAIKNEDVKNVLTSEKSWSKAWIEYRQREANYDDNFLKISNYIKNTKISKNNKN